MEKLCIVEKETFVANSEYLGEPVIPNEHYL